MSENHSFCASTGVVFNQKAEIKPLKAAQTRSHPPARIYATLKWLVDQFRSQGRRCVCMPLVSAQSNARVFLT
ncbi:MAG TPA: hypothetical protein PKE45_23050, partial [Caldilineaceae bacterium]|nr:hypothetical protein [Caldilineaceae bacterium]